MSRYGNYVLINHGTVNLASLLTLETVALPFMRVSVYGLTQRIGQ